MYLIVLFPSLHEFLCATSALYFLVCVLSQNPEMEYNCVFPNLSVKK